MMEWYVTFKDKLSEDCLVTWQFIINDKGYLCVLVDGRVMEIFEEFGTFRARKNINFRTKMAIDQLMARWGIKDVYYQAG